MKKNYACFFIDYKVLITPNITFINHFKYFKFSRLINTNLLKHVKKSQLKFDLDSKIPSKLPQSIQNMLKEVTNINMYMDDYRSIGADVDAMPFGRIDKKVVLKAKENLEKIKVLVEKKAELDKEKLKKVDAGKDYKVSIKVMVLSIVS